MANDLDDRIREMRAYFLVPPSTDEIFKDLDASVASLQAEYQPLAQAFQHNVCSVLSAVAIPFFLVSSSVEQSHFQRLHIAERIRARSIEEDALQPGESLEAVRDREAHRKAHARMQEFLVSEDGRNVIIRDICELLLASLRRGIQPAAKELLQQGLALLWSAFEVLARDAFEAVLNRSPGKVQALISDPSTRKRFEAQKLPLETLVHHGFDLSQRLGSVLVSQQGFSDLPLIKAAYSVLFPGNAELTDALADRQLWLLYQRRHLIVHRRGVVDRAYLDSTGEVVEVGSRLALAPKEFEASLKVVAVAGRALLGCLGRERAAS